MYELTPDYIIISYNSDIVNKLIEIAVLWGNKPVPRFSAVVLSSVYPNLRWAKCPP